MSILTTFFGDPNKAKIKQLQGIVDEINKLEPAISALTDEELRQKTAEFKERLAKGETLEEILPEAFAVVREASSRTLGQRHYDVQLMGGIVLHRRGIAEMRTGEGKTLVATLPSYLNALTGRGVHVVTVNDYLARRDAVWMGQIHAFLGLSIGVINNAASYLYDPAHIESDDKRDEEGSFRVMYDFLRPSDRRAAYDADITYGTNNEFGFDYLRDNISYDVGRLAQRPDPVTGRYYYAIIDEVDSILIDEARTPLIISAPSGQSESLYATFATIAPQLEREVDYEVDEKLKAISLTEQGIDKAEKLLGISDIYSEKGIKYVHHLETAIRAQALFELDRHYVIREGEIVIVDEFTGRMQPGRRWSEGLHQAIEAKEGVEVKEESRTFATVTLQNYFRLYEKISGMTGTAATSTEEFFKVYGLEVVPIPPNRVTQRIDLEDWVFQTEAGKFKALTRKVKDLQAKGQPVLIGTVSIDKNDLLSAYFLQAGIKHQVLNAKNHEQEGAIIAEAGKRGAVTLATNMAGRGIDIKLGGATPSPEAHEEIKALGGLYVIGTERHDARRIDNQLRGRAGRQGDPGETQFYLSLEDNLMRIFGSDRMKSMMGRFGIPEDEPIAAKLVSKAIEVAQTKIEGLNFDARKNLLDYDDVVNHQRVTIYDRRRQVLFGGEQDIQSFVERGLDILQVSEEERSMLLAVLKTKEEELGQQAYVAETKRMILQVIDMYWVEHLEAIDYMRSSVRLRAYGQRDPLVEFKREGLRLFKQMEAAIFDEVFKLLPNVGAGFRESQPIALQAVHEGAEVIAQNAKPQIVGGEAKIGRNDPCPCGSGKKWKKCGELDTSEHQQLMSARG